MREVNGGKKVLEQIQPKITKDLIRIKVLGIGGGGNNAVNQMIKSNIDGAEYILINTERQILDKANTNGCKTLQIGKEIAQGMGAGANPEVGEKAARESIDDIDKILSSNNEDEKNALKNKLASLPLNIKQNFVRSIRGKTVHDQADNMLYQYSYYNDTVNINSVPIYYLQPNTIISTKDELSRVTGYYVMNKINISLAYNGTMQITAIKSPERIY